MSERELTKEEMSQELANVKGKPSVPSDGVVFDKVRLDIMGKRAARRGNKPNNKRSKVPEQRDFMSEEEREEFIKKYGPYAAALQTDDERRYFIERRDEIFGSDEFNLDMILDTNIVLMVIMDEIILQRLFSELAKTPQSKSINAQITDVQRRYRENMRILDATREQRNAANRMEGDDLYSLAALAARFERSAREREKKLLEYQREEEEFKKRIALKAPVELSYYDEDDYESGGEDEIEKES